MIARAERTGQVVTIQYLRAIAAIAVVVFHLSYQVMITPAMADAASGMASGVDLFFVISGFVMAWSTLNGRRLSPGAFLRRRLIRIVPLYWLVTALMLGILLVAPQLLRTARLDWPHAVSSFLFVAAINPATGLYEPLVVPGWTLNYEMAFYGVFAGAIGLARGAPYRTLLIASAAIVSLVAAGLLLPLQGVAGFYTKPLILEFVMGMGIACIARTSAPVPASVLAGVAVIAAIVLFWPGEAGLDRALRRGIPAAFLIAAAAWTVAPQLRMLRILGDASYSIYLSHIVTVAVCMKLAGALHLLDNAALRAVTLLGGTLACTATGVIVWYAVERPLTGAMQRWRGKAPALAGDAHNEPGVIAR